MPFDAEAVAVHEAKNATASFMSWGFVGAAVNQVIAWLGFPGYMQLLFVALVVLDSIFGTWAAMKTGTFDPKRYKRMFRKFGYYAVLFFLAAFLRHAATEMDDIALRLFAYVIMFALCWTELVSFLKNLNKLAVANGDHLPFLSGVIMRVQRGGETFLKIEEIPVSRHGTRFMVSGDRVVLEGEIDIDIALELKHAMLAVLTMKKRICVDMGGVHFIDSSGVGAIVACIVAANKRMGLKSVDVIQLMDVPPRIKTVLEMHGLDKIVGFDCAPPPGLTSLGNLSESVALGEALQDIQGRSAGEAPTPS